ncbi:MAG: USH1C-binding protein 1 [Bilophila wadsworthia]
MSQSIGGVGGSGSVSGVGSLGTCTSVNFIFAKLQMELAASAKDSALGYIKQIEGAQAEQKEVADMLQRCRELQNQAKDSGGCTEMPADVREFMDKNNLTYDLTTGGVSKPTKETADSLHNKDEWDVAIQSLQAYQETIGTDIQTKMVYVQDFMGVQFVRRERTRPSSPVCRRLPPWLAASKDPFRRGSPVWMVPVHVGDAPSPDGGCLGVPGSAG